MSKTAVAKAWLWHSGRQCKFFVGAGVDPTAYLLFLIVSLLSIFYCFEEILVKNIENNIEVQNVDN